MKPDRSLKEFLAEAEDILESATQSMLAIEAEQNAGRSAPEHVNALFRAVHSFKGLAGMFGLKAHSDLSHKLEFLLDEIRLGKVALSRDALDVLFETLGLLGRLVQQAGKKQAPEDIAGALARIEGVLKAKPSGAAERSLLDQVDIDRGLLQVLTEYEEYRLKENIRERKNLYTVKASFELADFEAGIKTLNETLKKNAEIICTLPTASAAGGGIGFTIVAGTDKTQASLSNSLAMPNVAVAAVRYMDERRADEAKPEAGALRSVSNTVRVDIYKLDSLMNTVGEMHLTKNIIARIVKDLRATPGVTGVAVDLLKAQRSLERKLNELQEGILEVRMVPIGRSSRASCKWSGSMQRKRERKSTCNSWARKPNSTSS